MKLNQTEHIYNTHTVFQMLPAAHKDLCLRTIAEIRQAAINEFSEALKTDLQQISKGETHTWGFVAMFMDRIDKQVEAMKKGQNEQA